MAVTNKQLLDEILQIKQIFQEYIERDDKRYEEMCGDMEPFAELMSKLEQVTVESQPE